MKVTEKVQKEVEVTTDVFCNKCGGTCAVEYGPGFRDFFGLIETQVRGYYGSTSLEDCTVYTFSLCEACLKALFAAFTIPVAMKGELT